MTQVVASDQIVKIRAVRQIDYYIVHTLINSLANFLFDIKKFKKIYTRNLKSNSIIYRVAWYNKIPIGFISCHIQNLLHHNSAVGEIQEMFVVDVYRNQGVGKLMIAHIKSELTKRNVHQLEVVSNRKRKGTHQFYLHQKFKWTSKKFVLKF